LRGELSRSRPPRDPKAPSIVALLRAAATNHLPLPPPPVYPLLHGKDVALSGPGDARAEPNELAGPNVKEATAQVERALKKLGRTPCLVDSKPEAIEKLSPTDDPMVGICVHWLYGPHTCDGVVGKQNPLLLASNFSDQ
jgi:hypothetical protein